MKNLIKLVAAAALTGLTTAAVAGLPVYRTSFETNEGFNTGTYNQGPIADQWSVLTGSVQVVGDTSANEGDNFVTLNANTQLDRDFSNLTQTPVVWVEGYFRGAGSSVKLGGDSEPVYPLDPASAIVHFSEEEGIQMFDGDGQGGLDKAVAANVALGEANASTWRKITIQLNFDAKTWNLWVDDVARNDTALGFRDDSVNSLKGFRNLAQDSADFDSFRVVIPIRGDANGDGTADSADLVRLYEFITSGVTDPILLTDADLNSDEVVDDTDSMALLSMLIGSGG